MLTSTVISVDHRRVDAVEESITVNVHPTACSPAATDRVWLDAVLDEPDFEGAVLLNWPSTAIAGSHLKEGANDTRAIMVRGARLDALILHRGGPSTGEVISAPIRHVLESLVVPVNVATPPRPDDATVERLASIVDPDFAFDAEPRELIELGRSVLIHGWVTGERDPEWNAYWAVVAGFLLHGRSASDGSALYVAEQAISRLAPGVEVDVSSRPDSEDGATQLRRSVHQAVLDLPTSATYGSTLIDTLRTQDHRWVDERGRLTRPLPPLNAVTAHCNALLESGRAAAADPSAAPDAVRSLHFGFRVASSALVLASHPSESAASARAAQHDALVALTECLDLLNSLVPIREEEHELRVTLRRRLNGHDASPEDDGRLAHDLLQWACSRQLGTGPDEVSTSRGLVEEARGLLTDSWSSRDQRLLHFADALVSINEGSIDAALVAVERAARLPAESDLDLDEARAQVAALLEQTDRVDEAEAMLVGVGSPESVVVIVARARVAARRERVEDALAMVLDGLAVVSQVSAQPDAVRSLLALAAEFVSTSQPEACDYLVSAMIEIDRLRTADEFSNDERRLHVGDGAEHRSSAEALVERLIDRGRHDEALSEADSSRAFVLGRSVGRAASTGVPPTDPAVPSSTGSMASVLVGTRAVRRAVRARLHDLGYAVSRPGAELIATATAGGRQALIVQPAGDRILLVVIDVRGVVHVAESPADRQRLTRCLQRVHRVLGVVESGRGAGTDLLQGLAVAQRSWRDALTDIEQWLVEPARPFLADAPVIIVPHGPYALVPWAAVGEEAAPLVGELTVSVVPSLGVLESLRRRRRGRSRPRPERVLLIGEPGVDPGLGLRKLPGALAEVDALRRTLAEAGVPEDMITVLSGAAATDAAIRLGPTPDLVHFACHGTLSSPASMPALYLAPGDGDGLLTPAEIAEVPLDDALVVLSACQTGTGLVTIDGIVGLARSALEAGARTVVASLWEIEDRVTQALMGVFYPLLFGTYGGPPIAVDEALSRAVRAVRADLVAGRLANSDGKVLASGPQLWAPFTVIGDGAFRYG